MFAVNSDLIHNYSIEIRNGTEMAKATYTEISVIVNEMTDTTRAHHDTYAFAAGYLSSLLASIIADLPKHKQAEAIRNLQATTLKYAK